MQVIYDGKAGGPLLKEVLSQAVSEITMKDENVIYLDADLMSCINTLEWARANGSRAIDCGIAEGQYGRDCRRPFPDGLQADNPLVCRVCLQKVL